MNFCCPCSRKRKTRSEVKDKKSAKIKGAILQSQNINSTSSQQNSNNFSHVGLNNSTKQNSIKFIRQKVTSEIKKQYPNKKRILDSDLIFSLGLKKFKKLITKII